MNIRRGTAEDAAPLAVFAARTFADAFAADNSPEDMQAHLARAYGPAQQAGELADPGMITLLAEEEGRLVAYAQLRHGTPPDCVTALDAIELLRFYVDRPAHGRGVAQALMVAVRDAAAAAGACHLWLGVWEHNPRAIRFYSRCGFSDVGSQAFVLGGDRQTDRVMVGPVSSPTV